MKYPCIHNKYCFTLTDSNGAVKHKVTAHNIVLNNFYMLPENRCTFMGLVLGSGTTEPSMNDTKLTSRLFTATPCVAPVYEVLSTNHVRYSASLIVPADEQHVGTICEFGIYGAYGPGDDLTTNPGLRLITKGLLKDAEGNTISIDKTSVDRLTVDVEFHIQTDESDGFFWETCKDYSSFSHGFGIFPHSDNGGSHFVFSPYTLSAKYPTYDAEIYSRPTERATTATYYTLNRDSMLWSFNTRLPASCNINGRYIQSIILVNDNGGAACAWHFPSGLLPVKQVDNITVGVGDGSTTEFEPPISLWVEDTDTVYIDGVLQVRGVDYTIEHNANRSRLPEITPGMYLYDYECTGDYTLTESQSSYVNGLYCLIPFTAHANTMVLLQEGTSIDIHFDTDGQVGDTVNYWIPGEWYMLTSNGSRDKASNAVINISSSADGQEYTHVDSYVYTNASYNTPRNITPTTDKYWRITCDLSNVTGSGTVIYNTLGSILGYYGEPIKFTTPPAENAKITMSLQLDRPYKTKNFVFDIKPEFHFGGD